MFEAILREVSATFNLDALASGIASILPRVLFAALTLLLFWLFWRLISRALQRISARKVIDETALAFSEATAKYALMAIAGISALGKLGVDTSSVLASMGIAGLTLGFAARDTLSNIISGIFIFWDRPFVIGDLVEIAGHYGRVETITMRSTRVVTVDGKMLAIPNATVVNGTVVSYTNFPNLRLDLAFTVGVEEDLERVRTLLTKCAQEHPGALEERTPQVVLTAVGDYNLTMELRVWIQDERNHVGSRLTLRERAFNALRDAGIDMPYETLVLHQRPLAPAA